MASMRARLSHLILESIHVQNILIIFLKQNYRRGIVLCSVEMCNVPIPDKISYMRVSGHAEEVYTMKYRLRKRLEYE